MKALPAECGLQASWAKGNYTIGCRGQKQPVQRY